MKTVILPCSCSEWAYASRQRGSQGVSSRKCSLINSDVLPLRVYLWWCGTVVSMPAANYAERHRPDSDIFKAAGAE